MTRAPVTVLTGFLGSGKTTLLNALLRLPALADTAVVVNEVGEVGIDHLLVETVAEDVALLGAGCLCCAVRDDLAATLASLLERRDGGALPPFRRVVVETSGLADPAPILHTLLGERAVLERCRVDGIVATVDAVHGARQIAEHREALEQAALADRLVITKPDLAGAAAVTALAATLRSLNASAPIVAARRGDVAPRALLDIGALDPGRARGGVAAWLGAPVPGAARHDHRVRGTALVADAPLDLYRLVRWIETLLEGHGDAVLRLKGVIDARGRDAPLVVHGVRHVFHPLETLPAWPDDDRRSRLVVIARDLDPAAIEAGFRHSVLG